ncbi:hypothetical protein BH23BAC4_BH23BAC4_04810 [soil metagenome]
MFFRYLIVLAPLLVASNTFSQTSGGVFDPRFDEKVETERTGAVERSAYGTDETEGPGWVTDFAFHPAEPDRLLAIEEQLLLWETTDAGETWRRIFLPTPARNVVFAPSDPDVIYVAAGYWGTPEGNIGVVKSSDGGETWTQHELTPGHPRTRAVAVHPEDADVVVAGSGAVGMWPGIYVSRDSGVTWEKRDTNPRDQVLFASRDPDVAIARSERLSLPLAWSDDAGATWRDIPQADSVSSWLHLDRSDPERLYLFRLGEERGFYRAPIRTWEWERLDLDEHLDESSAVRHTATDPSNPVRIAVAHRTGVILSQDDGISWTEVITWPASPWRIRIAFDPHHPDRLWVATREGGLEALNLVSVGAETAGGGAPKLLLDAPFPNPARGPVSITFQAPHGEPVTVVVYDLLGRTVASLMESGAATGTPQQVAWHPAAAPGTYLIRVVSAGVSLTRLITLVE